MAVLRIVIQVSALLGCGAVVQAVVSRRASAATRHLIWMLALTSAVLLPAAALVVPEWPVTIPIAADSLETTTSMAAPAGSLAGVASSTASLGADDALRPRRAANRESTATARAPVNWPALLGGLYVAGVLALFARFLILQVGLRRFARRATVVDDPGWIALVADCARSMGVDRAVRLLRSRDGSIPFAFGTRRPAIVIPTIADTWDAARRRAVLQHELAHVARYDCLTERAAAAACALYWFHPAVWWIARRLRIERELACDDRVIGAGTEARDYAGHLLEVAYALSRHRAPALTVAMARRGQLEGRMLAALDGARNRRRPARSYRVAAAAIAIAVLGLVAAVRPAARAPEPPTKRAAPQSTPADAPGPHVVERHLRAGTPIDVARDVARRLVRSVRSAVGFAQGVPGTWEVRSGRQKGTVHLRIVEFNSSSDTNIPLDRLEGLTDAQLTGAGGPVQFRLRRDAGTFTFDGIVKNGVGAGTFAFVPDAAFAAELARRGYASPTASQQYQLARHDIGLAFVDELAAQKYPRPTTADLVTAGHHGVQAAYLRELGRLGYRLTSLEDLIELRDHGVTVDYVRELAALGYTSVSAEDLLRVRDHGVTPDYVRSIRDAGHAGLSLDALVEMRDHGVTPEFIRGLDEAGYRKLRVEHLIEVRDHGVTPQYARDLQQLGLSPPIDDLVRLRDHGVTPEYAKGLKSLGYDRLDVDDLITLRDHGLTIERIRSVNARAGTRLPVDLLKSFTGR